MEKVGDNIEAKNAGWSFGGDVPQHFSNHIRRSIPFYEQGHELILELSDFYLKPGALCYELGSATGELSEKLAQHHSDKKDCRFIGIDNEVDMLSFAKENADPELGVKYVHNDLLLYPYESADLIVSYYTLHFISLRKRRDAFEIIYRSLKPGAALILFEKVHAPDAHFEDMAQTLYTDYKLAQGYDPKDIVSKTRSLKGILTPLSSAENLQMLSDVGFTRTMSVFKYLCFEGFIAIKT